MLITNQPPERPCMCVAINQSNTLIKFYDDRDAEMVAMEAVDLLWRHSSSERRPPVATCRNSLKSRRSSAWEESWSDS